MSKSIVENITKGVWIIDLDGLIVDADRNFAIAKAYHNSQIENGNSEFNALLIADAGTTANKCGLLPSTLLEQRNELLGMLKGLVSDVSGLLSDYDIEWQQAGYYNEGKELINKHTTDK